MIMLWRIMTNPIILAILSSLLWFVFLKLDFHNTYVSPKLIGLFQVGWGYKSLTEDVVTSIRIHGMGYKSIYLMPKPPGFLGTVPTSMPASLVQKKRWVTGFNQVLFSKNSPIVATFKAKLQFRQCLSYTWILLLGVRSIPEICYGALSAFCIITNSRFVPKVCIF